mgnify:FL=1
MDVPGPGHHDVGDAGRAESLRGPVPGPLSEIRRLLPVRAVEDDFQVGYYTERTYVRKETFL